MRRRLTKYHWLALLLGLAPVAALALVRFGPQLQWRFSGGWYLTRDVKAIPVRPLPNEPAPDGFARCHFDSVTVSVPSGLVAKPEFRGDGRPGVRLRDGPRGVFISLPIDNRSVLAANQAELAGRGGLTSIPQLRAEIYAASPSDFRWSMSREELARHQWLLVHARFVRSFVAKAVETRLGGEVEGLLLIGEQSAAFEWDGAAGTASGTVWFDEGRGPLDLAWVRAICGSLRYSGGVFEPGMTADDVRKAFHVE